jgi:phosphoribosylaminoimidazole-succinocarboxamide synthase
MFFSEPIITPSTKASEGHDEDISVEEIINTGLTTQEEWETIERYALELFSVGKEMALQRGLILADTNMSLEN